jgi:hypothetical protein
MRIYGRIVFCPAPHRVRHVRNLTKGLYLNSIAEHDNVFRENILHMSLPGQVKQPQVMPIKTIKISTWTKISQISTCCIPSGVISFCCHKSGSLHQQGISSCGLIISLERKSNTLSDYFFNDSIIMAMHFRPWCNWL